MAQWKSELHGTDDKLPTVHQWLKTVSSEAKEVTRIVKLIWTPNMFDNYSLDTEAFRVRITPNHPLFDVLEENLEEWIEQGDVLAIQLDCGRKVSITLLTLDNEVGEWSALGDHGWKMQGIEAKPKKKVEAKTRKRVGTSSSPSQDAPEGASD